MLIGGGDPGVTGGIALLRVGKDYVVSGVELFKMPVSPYQVENKDGTIGNRNEVDYLSLGHLFKEISKVEPGMFQFLNFFLERPEPWGLSAYSALSLGSSYSAIHQASLDHGWTVQCFRPKDWKAEMGIPPKSKKKVSVALANELFPQMFYNLDKATTDGVAEALLIAECGRRRLAGIK